jgi:hypothetical protein
MENIVYLDAGHYAIVSLMERLSHADVEDKSVRICTGSSVVNGVVTPWLKWKIGEGCWTPPIYSQPDPNAPAWASVPEAIFSD